ncbi:MAG: hypothetical protein M3R38_38865 [Actinomycetota bacterium]|nr:hypothetical protein [Actinomycetota bacterium]
MMGDRERALLEERLLTNLIALVKLGRHTPALHEAAAEEERTSGVREILEEERRIEPQGRGGSS